MHDGGAGLGLFGTHAATLGRPVPPTATGQADAVIELLQTSFRICKEHPLDEKLGWYMAGGNGCEKRLELSSFRAHETARLLKAHPFKGEVDLTAASSVDGGDRPVHAEGPR